jgi:hypothetical protein
MLNTGQTLLMIVDVKRMNARFCGASKPTAVLCHGVASLIERPTARSLVFDRRQTVTASTNVVEDSLRRCRRTTIMPDRVGSRATHPGVNCIQAGLCSAFAVKGKKPDHRPASTIRARR